MNETRSRTRTTPSCSRRCARVSATAAMPPRNGARCALRARPLGQTRSRMTRATNFSAVRRSSRSYSAKTARAPPPAYASRGGTPGGVCSFSSDAPPALPCVLTLGYLACVAALCAFGARVHKFQLARADVLASSGFAAEFYAAAGVRGALVRRYLADIERRRLREALTTRTGSRYVAAAIIEGHLGPVAFEEWGDAAATVAYRAPQRLV